MTPSIILDPSGENPVSEQYQPVKTEVEFWNFMTLDNHYHRQTDPNAIANQVESDLSSLAQNISDIVMEAPDINELAVVIGSDHGQLLGPSSPISIELGNTEAHGRTAYGPLFGIQHLDENSYCKDDNLVVLNSSSFRLPYPVTLALDDGHFIYGKTAKWQFLLNPFAT